MNVLDQLTKIPIKTYLEKKSGVIGKKPVSSTTLTERTKTSTVDEHSNEDTTVQSQKRKDNIEQPPEKSKHLKSNSSRELFRTLARSIADLSEADASSDSSFDQDDVQKLCMEKVLNVIQKYKTQTSGKNK